MKSQQNLMSFKEMEVDLKQLKQPLKPYYHKVMPAEVDSFQVVNYSRYYEWLSAALLQFLKLQGLNTTGRFEDATKQMRVARVRAAYVYSARIGDTVKIIIHRIKVKQRHMVLYFRVQSRQRVLLRSILTVAFVDTRTNALSQTPADLIRGLIPMAAETQYSTIEYSIKSNETSTI
jgi:acyl-CoA thioesterase FadM